MRRGINVHKIAFLAMALALAVTFGIVESFIPNFLPGVKLGLPNLVIVLLLCLYPWYDALIISLLRVFLVSLLRGTIFQMPFFMSLAGAIASFLGMLLLLRPLKKVFTVFGASLLGAYLHTIAQVVVACLFVNSLAPFSYFPVISFLSLATGLLNASVTYYLLKRTSIRKASGEKDLKAVSEKNDKVNDLDHKSNDD